MERQTYEVEAQVEATHWWFRGRRRILRQLIDELSLSERARVLDVGCGTGANGSVLMERGRVAIGVDLSPIPLSLAGSHSARVRGDASHLPFADGSFDLVCALDILEHIDDDRGAAMEVFRVARAGAPVIVFVPAFMWLWGLQDDVSHHRRRYGKREILRVLEGAGFDIERVTYFNSLLFLPIFGARLAMRAFSQRPVDSENELVGPLSNKLFEAVFGLEVPLLQRTNLPLGVSLACVARKPA